MDQVKNIRRTHSWVWYTLLLLFALVLPFFDFMDKFRTSVAVLAGIYIILGLSLNIIVGYTGLFQLGHAAFFGLGAYTAAILSGSHGISILLTIPLAAFIAGLAAVLVSKPILHLRGDYLCIVTIAFGEIFYISVRNNIFGITGGANGLFDHGRPEFALPWIEPVPFITLAVIVAIHAFLTRRSGPVVQWGGAAAIAAGYYLPPLLRNQPSLYVVSIIMGLVVLGINAIQRGLDAGEKTQMIGLAVVIIIFALIMMGVGDALVKLLVELEVLDEGESLAATIDTAVQENFKVRDPVEGPLGLTLTPVAFKRDARPYYFLVMAFIVVTFIGVRRLQNSRLGRAWLYVREDELAAESMGIDTTQVKLAAFAIGSAWAGVAGVLYASRFTVVSPESFDFLQSVIVFCIVVLGGSGSIPGILVGTLGMVVLPELLRDVAPTFLWESVVPGIILAFILGSYLYLSRRRFQEAAIESGAIAGAFFLPALLLNQPPLYLIGTIMAIVAVVVIPVVRRRAVNVLPWLLGALAVYVVILLVAGGDLGPELDERVASVRIMDWRDGLMGVAMVVMMVLRPAGIIPERRRGVVASAAAEAPESAPAVATQTA